MNEKMHFCSIKVLSRVTNHTDWREEIFVVCAAKNHVCCIYFQRRFICGIRAGLNCCIWICKVQNDANKWINRSIWFKRNTPPPSLYSVCMGANGQMTFDHWSLRTLWVCVVCVYASPSVWLHITFSNRSFQHIKMRHGSFVNFLLFNEYLTGCWHTRKHAHKHTLVLQRHYFGCGWIAFVLDTSTALKL